MFMPGSRVRVHAVTCSRTHIRTPYYVRGCSGTVFQVLGTYGDPSALARGVAKAPRLNLYRVHFSSRDVHGVGVEASHTVTVDLYENWLEAVHVDDY